jgi:hypothetical protein
MPINCIKLRRYEKNTLRGFVDLELTNVGLVIKDCTWHAKDDGEWISFPARSYQKQDGSTGWQPLVEFAAGTEDLRAQFQRLAIEAIHAAEGTDVEVKPRAEQPVTNKRTAAEELNDRVPF